MRTFIAFAAGVLATLIVATAATLLFDNPDPCSTDTECGCTDRCLEGVNRVNLV